MGQNSKTSNTAKKINGTLIGEFKGGKIYTDGIQHGAFSISANLFGYSFGAEYDTITGQFGTTKAKTLARDGLVLDVDINGNVKTGIKLGPFDGGLITYSDGTKGLYAGSSLKAKLAEIGFSVDGTLPEHKTNLATYNSTTVFADGTVRKTEFRTVNSIAVDSGIAAFITVYRPNKPPEFQVVPVSKEFAHQMASGLANRDVRCFAAGTMIEMADGSERPIETIRPGDLVASFDEMADVGRGAHVPRRVVRTFVNENQTVIDLHGTKVTPGHAYLCGDGPHEGRFRQIMNIVRDDGAVVLADGTLMRAATSCRVGSAGDAFVELQIARPARNKLTGESVTLLKERGRIRAGTRIQRPDGSFFSFLDLIKANGWTLREDGLVSQGLGHVPEPLLWAGRSIPKPEDYILALSELTLADLYDDPRQAEAPDASSIAWRQGEATAVVLEAAGSSKGGDMRERSNPSLGSQVRALIDARRRKQNGAPRHAGEVVH